MKNYAHVAAGCLKCGERASMSFALCLQPLKPELLRDCLCGKHNSVLVTTLTVMLTQVTW